MIIYNANKEFLGIDEADLKALGYSNLASLQAESTDFADLLVKTPGHVHNFKHVHWIDFVLCAKSTQESRAIIHANEKNFKVILEVKTIYLSDAPSSKAYIIILNNLKNLSSEERSNISSELKERVAPHTTQIPLNEPITTTIIEDPYSIIEEDEDNQVVVDIYEANEEELANIGKAEVEEQKFAIALEEEPHETTQEVDLDEFESNEFIFDPQKTAEILEMPLSLIEEFVEDFIAQAKEFKKSLYDAEAEEDLTNLQAYSHKLKGVAANLRIEHALEILTKINKAKDFTTSKKDLDAFYFIIEKLSQGEQELQETNIPKIDDPLDDAIDINLEEENEVLEIIEDDFDLVEIDDDLDSPEEIPEELIISDDIEIVDDDLIELTEKIEEDKLVIEESQEVPFYNKVSIASDIGLDKSSFDELFSDYINESQNLIATIDDAISNEDDKSWKMAAIKLKGMSDNMRINNFITDLETLIITQDSAEARNALGQIQMTIFKILEMKD